MDSGALSGIAREHADSVWPSQRVPCWMYALWRWQVANALRTQALELHLDRKRQK